MFDTEAYPRGQNRIEKNFPACAGRKISGKLKEFSARNGIEPAGSR